MESWIRHLINSKTHQIGDGLQSKQKKADLCQAYQTIK